MKQLSSNSSLIYRESIIEGIFGYISHFPLFYRIHMRTFYLLLTSVTVMILLRNMLNSVFWKL